MEADSILVAMGGRFHLMEVTSPESGTLKRGKRPVLRARAPDYRARRGRPRRGRPVFRHGWRRKPELAPCMEPGRDFVAIGGELHLLEVMPPASGTLKRRKKPVLRARALDYRARRGRPRRGRPVFRRGWRRKPEWAPCMEPGRDFVAIGGELHLLEVMPPEFGTLRNGKRPILRAWLRDCRARRRGPRRGRPVFRRGCRRKPEWAPCMEPGRDFVAIGGELHLLEVMPPEFGTLRNGKRPLLRARPRYCRARRGGPRRGRPVFRHEWRRKP